MNPNDKYKPSPRAHCITRRSYNRPIDEANGIFETWEQTVDRVIHHQQWLWERALDEDLGPDELQELEELRDLMYQRKASVSGRTLWLGGTDIAKTREASQFNCAFTPQRTVHDAVDQIWLLLQGCGVGFKMHPGVLSGFSKHIPKITVIRSTATTKTNEDDNIETFDCGVWTIRIGDSAEAWAKAFGKLLAGKYNASELVLDFRSIRPGGYRLKGYGWISSGDFALARAMEAIAKILNSRAGQLLTKLNLLDIGNWMGSVLSSRRSAEIALIDYDTPEWEEFAMAKRNYWENGNIQRRQSNNSILFWHKPSKLEITGLFQMMLDAGGSDPGFINAEHAQRRAPWFAGGNPCFEILLGEHSFCNLVEIALPRFNGDIDELKRAIYLIGRANYRQTCVNLDDGILQRTWHELNEYLRLTGIGVTGVVQWTHHTDPSMWQLLRVHAQAAVDSMAGELGLPRSKAVTTIKPSGTLSKIMDVTEGIHRPMGKYIINWVVFGNHDPNVPILRDAGYRVRNNPDDEDSVIVAFPVKWDNIPFTKKTVKRRTYGPAGDGEMSDIVEANCEVEVNTEPAVQQLERYKLVMDNYVDHNCSITVSYDPEEIPEIVEWLDKNWNHFVGVSWLLRTDPTKTAADLGFQYLPQEVVTAQEYETYVAGLSEVDFGVLGSVDTELDDECSSGACPVR